MMTGQVRKVWPGVKLLTIKATAQRDHLILRVALKGAGRTTTAETSPPTGLVFCFRAGNATTGIVILATSACCAVQDLTGQITVTEEAPRELPDRQEGHEADQRKGRTNLQGEGEEQDHPIRGTEEIARRIGLYRKTKSIKYLCLYPVCRCLNE